MGEGQLSAISRQHSAKPRRQLRRKLLTDTPGKGKRDGYGTRPFNPSCILILLTSDFLLLFFLFYLVLAFGVVGWMLHSLLRFRFVHGAFGFFGALGAGRGTFLALFFLQFLTAQELDERG